MNLCQSNSIHGKVLIVVHIFESQPPSEIKIPVAEDLRIEDIFGNNESIKLQDGFLKITKLSENEAFAVYMTSLTNQKNSLLQQLS
jgi:hypothetical protein